MPSILYVTTDAERLHATRDLFAAEFPEILLMLSHPDTDGRDIAAAAMEHEVEVIIARGVLYTRVKNIGLPITVINAPVTALDTLHTLKAAKEIGTKVGAVASESVMTGVRELGDLMGLDLHVYPLDCGASPQTLVNRAMADGAEVILGGFMAKTAADRAGIPCVLVASREEGMLQAAREARGIVQAVRQEKRRAVLLHALLDHTGDGIVACDASGVVLVCNPAAERLLGVTGAVGGNADELFPALALTETIRNNTETLGRILRVANTDLVCSKIPVQVSGKAEAAVATVQDVRRIQQMEAKVRRSIYETGHKAAMTFDRLLWRSPAMGEAVLKAKEFALTDSSVLFLGETGTGKELFAQSVHNFSSRKKGPFVAINCAALPGHLLESELFGYESGAFTGANPKGKPGMFELAHGGTLLLDEVGEMDLIIQGKLLRVLEERKIMRLGGDRLLPVDVRLITATNRNLQDLIRKNAFRADLYYRLNVLRLKIPPLRERADDIPLLAGYFLALFTPKGKTPPRLDPEAETALQRHYWPGNVRELRNLMERIAALHKDGVINGAAVAAYLAEEKSELVRTQSDSELAEIYRVLAECNGNQTKAANALGMSRITLWRKLKRGDQD